MSCQELIQGGKLAKMSAHARKEKSSKPKNAHKNGFGSSGLQTPSPTSLQYVRASKIGPDRSLVTAFLSLPFLKASIELRSPDRSSSPILLLEVYKFGIFQCCAIVDATGVSNEPKCIPQNNGREWWTSCNAQLRSVNEASSHFFLQLDPAY